MWVLKKNSLVSLVNGFLLDLAAPSNLLWFWNFGFLLRLVMVIQVVRGFMLALYYNDRVNLAFDSVIYITNEVEFGNLVRFFHSRGARVLFFSIYIHIGRGIWYKSYYYLEVWRRGIVLFLLLIIVSFLGYVLPWGQMSFWAATVITNLLYVVPYIGGSLLEWVWGGFRVGGPTLSRFFILHYLFPFGILLLILVHLILLHEHGSRNRLGVSSINDKVEFHWFYVIKDLVSFVVVVMFFILLLLLVPFVFIDAENFLVVNIMKTPEHIKPEWHLPFAYCISRRIPNKLGGVIGLLIRVLIVWVLPWLIKSEMKYNSLVGRIVVVFQFVIFFILTWLGGCVVDWPYRSLGGIVRVIYFVLFFI